MTDQSDHRAVEIAPNWAQTARMLVVLMRDGSPDGKAYAASEIIRMGEIIDQLQAERGKEATGPGFPFDRTEDRHHGC